MTMLTMYDGQRMEMQEETQLQVHVEQVEQQARRLASGVSREELATFIHATFKAFDVAGTGRLSVGTFTEAVKYMEPGLKRKDLDMITLQVKDSFISYRDFTNFAYDLLPKLAPIRFLKTQIEPDQLAQSMQGSDQGMVPMLP